MTPTLRQRFFLIAGALLGLNVAGVRGAESNVGAEVPGFSVRDLSGKSATFPYRFQETRVLVVVFVSFDCPVSNSYVAPLSDLAKAYAQRNVAVIGIVPGEEVKELKRQVEEFKPGFAVFVDADLKAAAALQARKVPEAFVLDAERVVRYRGRIDDTWLEPGKRNAKEPRRDLRIAIDEVLAGKSVTVSETRAPGCPIPQTKRQFREAQVTFHKDVVPILQARCQECHRPGAAGPFSLMTYKQAVRFADLIKEYTAARQMPPWKPAGGPGYLHDRSMPTLEIDTLAAWVDGGTPAGDPKDSPPARPFPEGWALGKPDLVLEVSEDFHLGPTGPDHFRCFVLPTGLTEDKVLAAVEVKPGNARVVHHVLNFFDRTGTARKLEQAERERKQAANEPDRGGGYGSVMGIGFKPEKPGDVGGLGGWAPGLRGVQSPTGTGLLLPKGADVVLQIHYHRNGKPEKDRTRIGLYFARRADLKPLQTLVLREVAAVSKGFAPFDTIPAGEKNWRVQGRYVVEQDCTAYTVLPHMHQLGKSVRMTMTAPDGKKQLLIDIPDWDYKWQENYFFRKPIVLKAGTVLTIDAVYDNSAANPNNPSVPPQDVKNGEETNDEMLRGFLTVTGKSADPVTLRPLTKPADYPPGE